MNILDSLSYDPENGTFTWLKSFHKSRIGRIAGTIKNTGYYDIVFQGKTYSAHRLAFLFMTGEFPKCSVDHIDRNRLNNKWANLRLATKSQQRGNTSKSKANTSGFKGVSYHQGRWRAKLQNKYLGHFHSPEEAALVYNKAAQLYYGEYSGN